MRELLGIASCRIDSSKIVRTPSCRGSPQRYRRRGDAGRLSIRRPLLMVRKESRHRPTDATKTTHPTERDQFKVVMLGVLYGLSADGIARKLCVPPCRGRELLRMHRDTFRRFWAWSDAVDTQAMLSGKLTTVFGWCVHVGHDANPRSLRNFPMQGNGAEMMRLACA